MTKTSPDIRLPMKDPDIEALDWLFLVDPGNAGKVFFSVRHIPEILRTLTHDELQKAGTPDDRELLKCVGSYDPERFDLNEVNGRLHPRPARKSK